MIDDSWYRRPAGVPERLTAGGVVVRRQEQQWLVALAREADHPNFVIPKGGVEPGETIEAAALREVFEETGLSQLALLGKLGVLERLTFDKRLWTVTHLFLMLTTQVSAIPSDPHHPQRAQWFAVERLPPLFFPDQQRFIERNSDRIQALAAGR